MMRKCITLDSTDDLTRQIAYLSTSIGQMCDEPFITLDQLYQASDSTLGKLYQVFSSLRDKKDGLLHSEVFQQLIVRNTDGLITMMDRLPMNFIQFIEQIGKENQLNKEYLYEKLLRRTSTFKNIDRNNNALDSASVRYQSLMSEYEKDVLRLEDYFSRFSKDSDRQMSCSTFLECICRHPKFNRVDVRLELNDLFSEIQSSFIHQGVYQPGSSTIDFHGFLQCLEQICRRFNLNLTVFIRTLTTSNKKIA